MNKTKQITIDVPEDAFSAFRMEPKEFAEEMRLAAIVKWFEMGKISQSKASELSGLSRYEFLNVLYRFQVSPFQTTLEELEKEVGNA
ncbi:MAG: UPF0175 family protein [Candidatus Omnitrophota bacterium]|jgi:predicted HTH domain antitoxin|nr:MAG: UPF0175 family protein [Candidatus Omnitrophota bacterium]